jgi:hypothetical protein
VPDKDQPVATALQESKIKSPHNPPSRNHLQTYTIPSSRPTNLRRSPADSLTPLLHTILFRPAIHIHPSTVVGTATARDVADKLAELGAATALRAPRPAAPKGNVVALNDPPHAAGGNADTLVAHVDEGGLDGVPVIAVLGGPVAAEADDGHLGGEGEERCRGWSACLCRPWRGCRQGE